MGADLAELVDARVAGQDHPVADLDVAGEDRVVRHHALVADHAVVGHVGIGHEQVVVADAGDAMAADGAAVDGAELAEHVPVADLQARRLALVLLVLRRVADRGELEHLAVPTDRGRPVDHRVRPHPGALADLDAVADDRVGPDLDALCNAGLGGNYRARVDHDLTSGATIIVADATSLPSTSAIVENFQMPRIARSSVAFRTSWSPGSTGLRKRAPSMPTK